MPATIQVSTPLRKIRLVSVKITINGQSYIWIVDPDDLIFPRAATRVGPKYQAVTPPLNAIASSSISDDALTPKNVLDGEQRGGEDTVEVLGMINSLTDEEGALIFDMLLGNSD